VSARLAASLRSWRALFVTSLRLALREPVALFWNVVAPAFLLFAFALVLGPIPHAIGWVTAGLLGTSAIGTALFGVSSSLVQQRDQRILRRYGATPVAPSAIVLAELATGAALALIAATMQIALAAAFFGLDLHGRLVATGALLLVGVVAFMALGLVVGTLCTSPRTALVVGNALFLPFLLLGGAAIPLPVLPSSVARLSLLLPSRHFVDALARVFVRGATLRDVAPALAILAATAALGVATAALLFRFDPDQTIATRRRVAAIGGFVLLFGGVALARSDAASVDFAPPALARRLPATEPLLVDDFADGDLRAGTLGTWTKFTDRLPLLLGTSDATVENVAVAGSPDVASNAPDAPTRALHVKGFVTSDARFGGFAGVSLALGEEGHALDLTRWSKLRLRVRGDGGSYRVVLATPPLTNFDHLGAWFDAPSEWRTVELPLAKFAQSGFGPPRESGLERTLALQFLTAGAPHDSFELWIGEVTLLP
jgi:ABC-2 type transport system permease protein